MCRPKGEEYIYGSKRRFDVDFNIIMWQLGRHNACMDGDPGRYGQTNVF